MQFHISTIQNYNNTFILLLSYKKLMYIDSGPFVILLHEIQRFTREIISYNSGALAVNTVSFISYELTLFIIPSLAAR